MGNSLDNQDVAGHALSGNTCETLNANLHCDDVTYETIDMMDRDVTPSKKVDESKSKKKKQQSKSGAQDSNDVNADTKAVESNRKIHPQRQGRKNKKKKIIKDDHSEEVGVVEEVQPQSCGKFGSLNISFTEELYERPATANYDEIDKSRNENVNKPQLGRTLSDPTSKRPLQEYDIDLFDNEDKNSEKKKVSLAKTAIKTLKKTNLSYDKANESIVKVEEICGRAGIEIPTIAGIVSGRAAAASAPAPPAGAVDAIKGVTGKVSGDQALKATSLISILALGATIVVALTRINNTIAERKEWRQYRQNQFLDQLYSFGEYYKNLTGNDVGPRQEEWSGSGNHQVDPSYARASELNRLTDEVVLVRGQQLELTHQLHTINDISNKLLRFEDEQKDITDQVDVINKHIRNMTEGATRNEDILDSVNQLLNELSHQLNDSLDKNKHADRACPKISFQFPRDNQISDYVRYRGYFARLASLTACMWVETDNFIKSILSSYATIESDNMLTITIIDATRLRVSFHRRRIEFTMPSLLLATRNHICVSYSSRDSVASAYVNGVKTSTVIPIPPVLPILGGGDLLLGQEQDGVDAQRLDPNQAFSGNITNFMIWPRPLEDGEIVEIARLCHCPPDYVITMSVDRVEMFGEAEYFLPDECPVL